MPTNQGALNISLSVQPHVVSLIKLTGLREAERISTRIVKAP